MMKRSTLIFICLLSSLISHTTYGAYSSKTDNTTTAPLVNEPVQPPEVTSTDASTTQKKEVTATQTVIVPTPIEQETTTLDMPVITPFPLTGTFDITTNYVFRGISQSHNGLAFQGGLTYTFYKTGIYFSIWGSNVNFYNARQEEIAPLETDLIAGISNTVGKYFSYNFYFLRYTYPKSPGLDYNEVNGSLTYRWFNFAVAYSGNVFASHHTGVYYNLGVNVDLPTRYTFQIDKVGIFSNLGYYDLPKETGLASYEVFTIGLQKKLSPFTLMLQWYTTSNTNARKYDGSRVVGTILANF